MNTAYTNTCYNSRRSCLLYARVPLVSITEPPNWCYKLLYFVYRRKILRHDLQRCFIYALKNGEWMVNESTRFNTRTVLLDDRLKCRPEYLEHSRMSSSAVNMIVLGKKISHLGLLHEAKTCWRFTKITESLCINSCSACEMHRYSSIKFVAHEASVHYRNKRSIQEAYTNFMRCKSYWIKDIILDSLEFSDKVRRFSHGSEIETDSLLEILYVMSAVLFNPSRIGMTFFYHLAY